MIAGLVIATMQLIKKYLAIPQEAYFIPVLLLATALNTGNAYFFGEGVIPMKEAIAEGIRLGAEIAGVFGLGKPIIEAVISKVKG